MELADYLKVLRAHWAGILASILLCVTAAGLFTLTRTPVYTAEASGYVAATGATDLGTSMVGDQLARSKVKSYLDIGSWRTVAEYAIDELQLTDSPEALVNRVSITNPNDTVVVSVSARAATPEAARDLAETWIRGMINEIELIEGTSGQAPVTLFPGDSARLPTAPSSPDPEKNLALGFLLGALLGAGYAIIRDYFDRRIKSAEGVERATGLAVVGSLPLTEQTRRADQLLTINPDRPDAAPVVAESFRGLRTNLQYMNVDDPPRAIVVTSPLPGDGKTFTAANLAITLAASGQRTVLLDADLRRPHVASTFGLLPDAGLSDVLSGRAHHTDVLQPVAGSNHLQVMAAGPIPPNPSELLGSDKMRQLINTLTSDAMVIIDSPPLLPVTDSTVLSTQADGALVVVSTGATTYDMLDQALDNLNKANAKPLGVVLNKVPKSGPGSIYYQYTGDYVDDSPARPVGAGSADRTAGTRRRDNARRAAAAAV